MFDFDVVTGPAGLTPSKEHPAPQPAAQSPAEEDRRPPREVSLNDGSGASR